MRILMVNQSFFPDLSATAQQILDLGKKLVEEGHQVTVVASRRNYTKTEVIYPKREKVQGIEIERVSHTGFGRAHFLLRVLDGITFELAIFLKVLFMPRHDILVCFTSPPLLGFIGVCLAKIKKMYCVQWLMDINPAAAVAAGYLKANQWSTRFMEMLFNFSNKHSQKIVVLDTFMQKEMLDRDIPKEKILVIPPWGLYEMNTNRDAGKRFRQEKGFGNQFVVMYSGNHSVVNPLESYLKAIREMKHSGFLFVFIGEGYRVQEVTQAKNRWELDEVIQLPMQPREILPESLGSASMHLLTLGNEMSGLLHLSKLYGILTTGKPFLYIGPKKSHVVELTENLKGAFFAEHGNIRQIQKCLQEAKSLSTQDLILHQEGCAQILRRIPTKEKLIQLFISSLPNRETIQEEIYPEKTARKMVY